MYFPAFFIPVSEGGYFVNFPDLPEAFTQGCDLDESLTMAQDVLVLCLKEYVAQNRDFPAPSSPDELDTMLEEQRKRQGVDTSRKSFIQLISVSEMEIRNSCGKGQ